MELTLIISKQQLQLIAHILTNHQQIKQITKEDREEAEILASMILDISNDPQSEGTIHDLIGY